MTIAEARWESLNDSKDAYFSEIGFEYLLLTSQTTRLIWLFNNLSRLKQHASVLFKQQQNKLLNKNNHTWTPKAGMIPAEDKWKSSQDKGDTWTKNSLIIRRDQRAMQSGYWKKKTKTWSLFNKIMVSDVQESFKDGASSLGFLWAGSVPY